VAGEVTISDVEFEQAVVCAAGPTCDFGVISPRRGSVRLTRGDLTDRAQPGRPVIVAGPGEGYRGEGAPRLDLRAVTLEWAALERAVRDLHPDDEPSPVSFTHLGPRSPAAAAHWDIVVRHAYENLDASLPSAPRLLVDATTQVLAHTALAVFPNPVWDDAHRPGDELARGRDARDGMPGAVRRAVAHIEANLDRPLSVAELAAAARVTPRALQYAFQRHLHLSPTEYVRQLRLRQARAELLAGTSTSVAALAARWGFTSRARFSAAYRAMFGESPQDTLRGR
jgi:AraC-like DNA-binding protein